MNIVPARLLNTGPDPLTLSHIPTSPLLRHHAAPASALLCRRRPSPRGRALLSPPRARPPLSSLATTALPWCRRPPPRARRGSCCPRPGSAEPRIPLLSTPPVPEAATSTPPPELSGSLSSPAGDGFCTSGCYCILDGLIDHLP